MSKEQREKLRKETARLGRNASGALRPVDVFDEALALDLSDEQHALILEIKHKLRASIAVGGGQFDLHRRAQVLQRVNNGIRKTLTHEQRVSYDERIRRLRPDTLPGVEKMDFQMMRGKTPDASGLRPNLPAASAGREEKGSPDAD